MSDLGEKKTLLTKSTDRGERIDKYLAQFDPISTRSRAQKLIDRDLVKVNGSSVKASYKVQGDEVIEVVIPEDTIQTLEPYDFPIDVLFEDDSIIVINKPAGIVVHPSVGHGNNSMVNALIFHRKDLSLGFNELRPGVVHRIDKDTSGVIVFAKNNSAHLKLAEQFKLKTVHRIYRTVVYGSPARNEGRIESRLARDPHERKRFASVKRDAPSAFGKRAVTHFTVKARHPSGLSLIECRLETGRTHQIRVHLSEMGCAIVNDPIYGQPKRFNQLKSDILRRIVMESKRLALHACELGFVHPATGKQMLFKSESPPELDALFEIFKT